MWGANGMLSKKNFKSLLIAIPFAFSCLSCTEKVSDVALMGLIEGKYTFKSVEGEESLPDGWNFTENSYFEFKKYENGTYNKHDTLPNGLWIMNKFTYENGNGTCISGEFAMEWHNTPFNNIKSLRPGGVGVLETNEVYFSMNPPVGEELGSGWHNAYYIGCTISPINKHEFSKRKLKIGCYDINSNFLFSIAFSNE